MYKSSLFSTSSVTLAIRRLFADILTCVRYYLIVQKLLFSFVLSEQAEAATGTRQCTKAFPLQLYQVFLLLFSKSLIWYIKYLLQWM